MSSTNKISVLCGLMLAAGCNPTMTIKHEVEPIDITINIKVDRELDSFFDFEDEAEVEPGESEIQ